MPDGVLAPVDAWNGLIPDASIWCRDASGERQPWAVFEVAVTSLAHDLTHKRSLYFRNPAVQIYVVIDVRERLAWVWRAGVREPEKIHAGAIALDHPAGAIAIEHAALWRYLDAP